MGLISMAPISLMSLFVMSQYRRWVLASHWFANHGLKTLGQSFLSMQNKVLCLWACVAVSG